MWVGSGREAAHPGGRPCRGQAMGREWRGRPSPRHGKNLGSDEEDLGGSSSVP